MFDEDKRSPTWTAAGLSDFKELYNKLATGTLRWVLSTGLPLHTNFSIWLDGKPVTSSKINLKEIKKMPFGEMLPGIGAFKGSACIYENQLTTGKSEQHGRSNGFFIRVRGRVINLEDELFGVQQPNPAAWSRFSLEVDADGLREMDSLEEALINQGEIPLNVLFQGLEREKSDPKATPNVIAVRAKLPALQEFEPERLIARLKAVESIVSPRWIEVEVSSGEVLMHQTAEQILADLDRNIGDLAIETAGMLSQTNG